MMLRQTTVTFRFKMCISELFIESWFYDTRKVKPKLLPQSFTSKFWYDSLIKDFFMSKIFWCKLYTIYLDKHNFKVCFIDISVSSVVCSKWPNYFSFFLNPNTTNCVQLSRQVNQGNNKRQKLSSLNWVEKD